MAKISKRQARLASKRQDSVTDTIEMDGSKFICIFDVKTKVLLTYDYCNEDWEEISKDPDLKLFSTQHISRFVAEKFNDDSSSVSAVALVQRHLKQTDAKLLDVIEEQKHNTFVIVIDVDNYENGKVDLPSFVFASHPSETFDDANSFGNGIAQMYLETSKKL